MLIGFRPCANVTQPGDDIDRQRTRRTSPGEVQFIPKTICPTYGNEMLSSFTVRSLPVVILGFRNFNIPLAKEWKDGELLCFCYCTIILDYREYVLLLQIGPLGLHPFLLLLLLE